ncbi:MAG: hypothetical protein JXR03_15800 [Cyclobacteriaceae bacterium]
MNIADLQLQLHRAIDATKDGEKLQAIFSVLKKTKGPHGPMSQQEYIDSIDEARQQIEEGKSLTVEELEKQSDLW